MDVCGMGIVTNTFFEKSKILHCVDWGCSRGQGFLLFNLSMYYATQVEKRRMSVLVFKFISMILV